MQTYSLTDDWGRETRFEGELLLKDTSDTEEERKPQYVDLDIYRTSKNNYVVVRATHYRYRHLDRACSRVDGNLTLRPPVSTDTYPCPRCNNMKVLEPGHGYGMSSRKTVDVYPTPFHLIKSMEQANGSYSGLANSVLAELSTKDDDIKAAWAVREA